MVRVALWTVLALQAAYWAAATVFGYLYATGGDGGLQWLASLFATPPFAAFTLPALILAVRGRRMKTALALGLAGLVCVPLLLWYDLAGALAAGPTRMRG